MKKESKLALLFLSYLADKNRLLIVLGKQARHQVVGAGYLQ